MLRLLCYPVSLLACGTAVAAQSAPSDAVPDGVASAPRAVSPPAEGRADIGDIVVTASRRAENIQKAALSIQALSSETLTRANVSRPEDLSTIAAGVSIGSAGAYPQVYIRGVGNYGTQSYAEGAVAFNLDGVYISRGWATRGMFYDLERVEVLKGPQGTLYGRNASGGAINVITARPKFDDVSGFAEVQAGNYSLIQGTAALNLPLGDTVAVRASGQVISRDGYLSDGYNDDETQAARLQLLWKPSEDFSLLLNGNYQHVGGNGSSSVLIPQLPGDAFRGTSDPAVVAIIRAQPGTGPLLVVPRDDGFMDGTVYAVGAEINWDLGFATLTVLPAYRYAKLRDKHYSPGFQVEDNENDKQTSIEARLGNDGDRLKWVLGAYYFNESQRNPDGMGVQVVKQGLQTQDIPDFSLRTRSYAAFGQATYSLTDRLRLTGGLRYTYERKVTSGVLTVLRFGSTVPTIVPLGGRLTYNNVTYKGGLEYDLAPRSMAYASISSGFKSGGFFTAPPPNTFDPEKMTAFEAGVKNRFLDNRLQVNLEAFYWRYKDHQEAHIGPTTIPGFFTFITENAGSAESYGGDLDILFRATPRDELSLKVQYNKSRYNTFEYSYPSAIFGTPVVGCTLGPVMSGAQTVDCSGKQLVRTPTWSGTAGYSHTFDLGDAGSLRASGDVQFASGYFLSIDFLPVARQQSYAVGNFDMTYTSEGGRWVVSAFIRNIWNEAVHDRSSRYPFVSSANPLAHPSGFIVASIRPPRTFGGRVRLNF